MDAARIIKERKRLQEELRSRLTPEAIRRASRDHHARRAPRPCGMTVHVGIGCTNRCLYCYIQDMGFPFREARPYPLSGDELLYALLCNPFFVPGRMGSFIAFGSVTEPFLPQLKAKTFEYMEAVSRLGNPIQFSTKMKLSEEDVEKLKNIAEGAPIHPLITIVSLKKAHLLEPRASSVEDRLETIELLRSAGFKPFLFLRPIMPGINDNEVEKIIAEAADRGAVGVVLGSMRITKGALARLRAAGFNVNELLRRAPRPPRGSEQLPVRTEDVKKRAADFARSIGLVVHFSACCGSAFNASVPCYGLCFYTGMCSKCPNDCPSKLPPADPRSVAEAIAELEGSRVDEGAVTVSRYVITVRGARLRRSTAKFVETLFRRKLVSK